MPEPRIRPDLAVQEEALAAFCHRHGIIWLAVYGSVLRDDVGPASDIDVIVEFAPAGRPACSACKTSNRSFRRS